MTATKTNEPTVYLQYTQAQLEKAFNEICDPADWRNPIDAPVKLDDVLIYISAVEYFTSTQVECIPFKDGQQLNEIDGVAYIRLTSVGYRMGPAGP